MNSFAIVYLKHSIEHTLREIIVITIIFISIFRIASNFCIFVQDKREGKRQIGCICVVNVIQKKHNHWAAIFQISKPSQARENRDEKKPHRNNFTKNQTNKTTFAIRQKKNSIQIASYTIRHSHTNEFSHTHRPWLMNNNEAAKVIITAAAAATTSKNIARKRTNEHQSKHPHYTSKCKQISCRVNEDVECLILIIFFFAKEKKRSSK